MTQTALILGATGRFGRNSAEAFRKAGWTVRNFDRKSQDLKQSAEGASIIVNAWNPPYPDWARLVPKLHRQVIDAAEHAGAAVIVPGNVYVFGASTPLPWSSSSPHLAKNPLGRIRVEMEDAYRSSSVKTIILRAGDFIDTCPSGNWFDQVLIKRLSKGQLVYPGRPDIAHSWAYLPDLARAAVALAEIRDDLPRFSDVPFAGYTLTGTELAQSLSRVTGHSVRAKRMNWLPIHLSRMFWNLAPHLIEMRYLWDTPHCLDAMAFNELVPGFTHTDLDEAINTAIADGQPGLYPTATTASV